MYPEPVKTAHLAVTFGARELALHVSDHVGHPLHRLNKDPKSARTGLQLFADLPSGVQPRRLLSHGVRKKVAVGEEDPSACFAAVHGSRDFHVHVAVGDTGVQRQHVADAFKIPTFFEHSDKIFQLEQLVLRVIGGQAATHLLEKLQLSQKTRIRSDDRSFFFDFSNGFVNGELVLLHQVRDDQSGAPGHPEEAMDKDSAIVSGASFGHEADGSVELGQQIDVSSIVGLDEEGGNGVLVGDVSGQGLRIHGQNVTDAGRLQCAQVAGRRQGTQVHPGVDAIHVRLKVQVHLPPPNRPLLADDDTGTAPQENQVKAFGIVLPPSEPFPYHHPAIVIEFSRLAPLTKEL